MFFVARPFSTCGNTTASKLCTEVTEGIPSAQVKFCSNRLKLMKKITTAVIRTAVLKNKQ